MLEVAEGIRRVTFPLPLGIDHVHCYLVRMGSGGWMLVDTGLGLPGAEERWAPVLGALDAPVERIVVTHYHPDHVGDAATVAELTGAPVFEGRLDAEQCRRTWGAGRESESYRLQVLAHGMPEEEADEIARDTDAVAAFVHPVEDPEPLEPESSLDGWRVLCLPGHADGHLALLRDGVLLAGDSLLARISPVVGLYPDGRPDPLGDFLGSLRRIAELAPEVAFSGHEQPVADPARRARELLGHHGQRLDAAAAALSPEPRSGWEVSLDLFGPGLPPSLRRFAFAEALAHLERLVLEERAERRVEDGRVLYRRPAGR